MIIIKNKRCKLENIRKEYPGAIILDVTSKGALKTFSPFYPHGDIQVFGTHVLGKLNRLCFCKISYL